MRLKINAPTENETQEIASHFTDATIPTYPHVLNGEKIQMRLNIETVHLNIFLHLYECKNLVPKLFVASGLDKAFCMSLQ